MAVAGHSRDVACNVSMADSRHAADDPAPPADKLDGGSGLSGVRPKNMQNKAIMEGNKPCGEITFCVLFSWLPERVCC